MKLFYSPNACSLGIHMLLEEIGKPFELVKVDFGDAAQYKSPFVDLNPKSKVPALLRDDGGLVTEFPAIAFYLGLTNPEKNLLPKDADGQTKALELLDYMIATMHMRGYTRIFRPGNFAPSLADEDKVKAAGRDFVTKGFAILEPEMAGKDFLLDSFSIVDAALFFLTYWARHRANIPMPPAFDAYLDRMLARPAAQRALATEGLT
jgi:glutathione S-transferase